DPNRPHLDATPSRRGAKLHGERLRAAPVQLADDLDGVAGHDDSEIRLARLPRHRSGLLAALLGRGRLQAAELPAVPREHAVQLSLQPLGVLLAERTRQLDHDPVLLLRLDALRGNVDAHEQLLSVT